ncbi:hypothetical protein DY124_07800 [Apilactobacillus micheneri]|uniref:hypothetical protein n=1 Tax=Apilactobacillus micheneri TaxID=1899430 RepID=UPI00112C0BD9|nr:hypothetical protein [Apilactobacillus micheneri]TPR42313.1 hypothetical protein DY124_07800 [Apilactobacillus micheneri]TPR47042.1 hypothetical protein DY125_07670 [Apilactobacillus micheneri]
MNSVHIRLSDEVMTKIDLMKAEYQMKSRNEVINFIIKNFVYEYENPDHRYQKLLANNNYVINNMANSLSNMNDILRIISDSFMD